MFIDFTRLAEVSLEQSLECLTVTSLVANHLMNAIVDSDKVKSFCSLCEVELALGCAVLCRNSHLKIFLDK